MQDIITLHQKLEAKILENDNRGIINPIFGGLT